MKRHGDDVHDNQSDKKCVDDSTHAIAGGGFEEFVECLLPVFHRQAPFIRTARMHWAALRIPLLPIFSMIVRWETIVPIIMRLF
jgi:hypothetical protein